MCKHCIREPFVPRERFVSETGAYFPNLKDCAACGKPTMSKARHPDGRPAPSEDAEEVHVVFDHVCEHCGHVIATHEYDSIEDDGRFVTTMNCMLCGCGEETQWVDPDDPRANDMLF